MNRLIFIKKEIAELKQCKKLILLILVALIYQLFLNIIADNPVIPIGKALYLSSFISVCLSAEIVYILMVDEFKKGTFDIILLSKCKVEKLLLVKIMISSIIAIISTGFGRVINNVGALFIEKVVPINGLSLFDYLQIVFAGIICAMSAMYFMLKLKKYDNTYLTWNIIAVSACFIVVNFVSGAMNSNILIVIWITSIIFIYKGILGSIYNKKVNRHSNKRKKQLFTENDNTWYRSISKRELTKLLEKKGTLFKLMIMVIGFVIINSIMSTDQLSQKLVVWIELFMFQMIFVMDIYFDLAKQEVYAKMDDILQLAGVSKRKNFLMIGGISTLLGMMGGIIFFAVGNMVELYTGDGILLTLKDIIIYFMMLILCSTMCYVNVTKSLKSMKEERIVRLFTYGLCLVISVLCVLSVNNL